MAKYSFLILVPCAFITIAADKSTSTSDQKPEDYNTVKSEDAVSISWRQGFPSASIFIPKNGKSGVSASLSVDQSIDLIHDTQTGRDSLILYLETDKKHTYHHDFDLDGKWDFMHEFPVGTQEPEGKGSKFVFVDGKQVGIRSLDAKGAMVSCIGTDGKKLLLQNVKWIHEENNQR
jgi:hypothetical protein